MVHAIKFDDDSRCQHRGNPPAAVAQSAFPRPDRPRGPDFLPKPLTLLPAFPDAQLICGVPKNLITTVARPIQKRVVGQHEFAVARTGNGGDGWAGIKCRAKARFALAQSRLAGPQLAFGFLPFADIGDERLDDLTPAPLNSGQSHFQWHFFALRSATHPFETCAAVGHAFLDIFTGQHSGTFTIWLKWRRRIGRISTQQFLWILATHNPHRGGIHLKKLVLVLKDDSLTGTFEKRAKLFFRLAERLLGALALGVINDAGPNQILALRRQAQ